MRNGIIYWALLLLFYTVSLAQSKPSKVTISGALVTEQERTPIEAATIYIVTAKDSSLVSYTTSTTKGKFVLKGKTIARQVHFYVVHMGFKTYFKVINLDSTTINLGNLPLKPAYNTLDEVTVKAVAPIVFKKDTIEYNAASFKTKKNAVVEDLLQQLPGFEVDIEGEITYNNKEVAKILVNGRPFFGNDYTIATKNLIAELIEKVQVVDSKTKMEAFLGEMGEGNKKTINLIIDPENNKGVFGHLLAGVGTQERYGYSAMGNLFNNDKQLSILESGNNINYGSFSLKNIKKTRENSGRGIATLKNTGVNYTDELGKKTNLAIRYGYNRKNVVNKKQSQRENILPENRFSSQTNSITNNIGKDHSAKLNFDTMLAPSLLVNVVASFNAPKTETHFSNKEQSTELDNTIINESNVVSFKKTKDINWNNNFSLGKRIGNKGNSLKFIFKNRLKALRSDRFLNSQASVFNNTPEQINRNQFIDTKQNDGDYAAYLSYKTQIIGNEKERIDLAFYYNYNNVIQKNLRSSFDFDIDNEEFSIFNSEFSTNFKYKDVKNSPGLILEYRRGQNKLQTSLQTNYVFRTLENKDALKAFSNAKRKFKTLEFQYDLRYNFTDRSYFRLQYNLNNKPPRLNELQTFEDVSNPLNVIKGNPNLKPTNIHEIGLNYFKAFNLSTNFRARFFNNTIVQKTTLDANLLRTTSYTNVNGNYEINYSIDYNSNKIVFKNFSTLKLQLELSSSLRRYINFNDDIKYASKVATIEPSIGFRFIGDIARVEAKYKPIYTKNSYDINEFDGREFLQHELSLKTAIYPTKFLEWRNNVTYRYNSNVPREFERDVWFWNSTLIYTLLKNKATLALTAYDLLNQLTNTRRIANQNYIENSQNVVLQQYFLLSFKYNFRNMGVKKK